jgi:hypothetical protein
LATNGRFLPRFRKIRSRRLPRLALPYCDGTGNSSFPVARTRAAVLSSGNIDPVLLARAAGDGWQDGRGSPAGRAALRRVCPATNL